VGDVAGCLVSTGYVGIRIDYVSYLAHRLAFLYMEGYIPTEVDHINHIPSDNRWENLREVSHKDNQRNRPRFKNNTSGATGVTWCKQTGKWKAAIRVNGISKTLGRYSNKADAVTVREAANMIYGYHDNHGGG